MSIKFDEIADKDSPYGKCRICNGPMDSVKCFMWTCQNSGAYCFTGLMPSLCKEFKAGEQLTICHGVVVNEH